MKSSSTVYVSQHSFAVCPVGFLYLVKLKFLQQDTTHLDAAREAVSSSLGTVTDCNGLQWRYAKLCYHEGAVDTFRVVHQAKIRTLSVAVLAGIEKMM